jgi:hypothetical protein
VQDRPPDARKAAMTAVKYFVAAVPVVATLVALTFSLWPSLKPPDPPTVKAASFRNVLVDHPVSFRQYLRRADLPASGHTVADLERVGALVQFDLAIQGFRGAKLPLRWMLFDAGSGDLVFQSKNVLFKPVVETDGVSWQEWIRIPRRGRAYYVMLQLYDAGGRIPLATGRSKTFRG